MVGVSRNLPKITSKSFTWNVGIVGVHPQHILSEYIDLTALQSPPGEIIDGRWHDPFIDIPFWLLVSLYFAKTLNFSKISCGPFKEERS